MRIDELTITNFKCFENETFHFNPHFNVVIGKNASGKSSLLDAVAVAVSCYFLKVIQTSARFIYSSDIRREWIDGQPREHSHVIVEAKGAIHNDEKIDWKLEGDYLNRVYHKNNTIYHMEGGLNLAEILKNDLKLSRTKSNATIFPLIVYYHTNRLSKQLEKINFNEDESAPLSYKEQREKINYFKQEEGIFLAYKTCLEGEAATSVFLSWFKTYEDEVRKFHQPTDELFLKIFRDTISSMVPEWTDIAFSFKDDDMMGLFKGENGQINRLPFKSLSDGYRNIIGMVADMVYRSIQLNPGLKENVLIETNGIVLIDELDLHLHPEWQRRVVGDLKRIFPKVQFIATTHSPFIIQETSEGQLIKMSAGKTVSTGGADEYSLEDVAEYIQDVNDPAWSLKKTEMYYAAKRYFEFLNELQPGKGNGELNKIREELNILGKPYSDNVAYTAFLEQKRFLAQQNLTK